MSANLGSPAPPPSEAGRSQEVAELLRVAWERYGEGRYEDAVEPLEAARRLAPGDAEPVFALGLNLKKLGRKVPAADAFRQAASLAESLSDRTRGTMLRRLCLGHVNHLERGQWDLEREVWGKA